MSLLTLLFHLPAVIALALVAVRFSSSASTRIRDTFLLTLGAFQIEHLVLGAIGEFDPISVGFAHVALLALSITICRRSSGMAAPTPPASSFAGAVIGGWIAIVVCAAIARIALYPDPYDSLTYHLMLPAHWIETGGLGLLPTYFGDIAPTYSPTSIESFYALLMLPLGHDAWARVGQLPFAALAGYSVACLACSRIDRPLTPAAALAGATFLVLPEVLVQSTDSMVDLAAAALLLSAIAQLRESMTLTGAQRTFRWLIAGLAAGLFLSSRFTSLVFLPLLIPPLVRCLRGLPRGWLAFGAGLIVFGAYPYVRNSILTGNPVFPVEVAGLPGLFTREATHTSRYHLTEIGTVWSVVSHRFGMVSLSIAGIGLFAPWAWLLSRDDSRRDAVMLAFVAALGIALHFSLVPYNANTRFLFVPWGCAIAAAATALRMPKGGSILFFVIAPLSVIASFLGASGEWHRAAGFPLANTDPNQLIPFALAALALIGAAIGWSLSGARQRTRWTAWVALGVISSLAVSIADHHRRSHWAEVVSSDPRVGPYTPGLRTIDELEPATIAYSGRNIPYLLRGAEGQHRVLFVPADGSPIDTLPHEFSAEGQPANAATVEVLPDRQAPNQARWWTRLRDSRVDYLAVFGRDTLENRWAGAISQLVPVETTGDLFIYEVDR